MNYWSSELNSTGEKESLRYIKNKFKSNKKVTIFDVGANLGEFSILCHDVFKGSCSIHAFEPSSTTRGALKLNVGMFSDVIKIHSYAISSVLGKAVLHTSEDCSSIASLETLERPIRPLDPALDETVELMTLDQFCRIEKIEKINFLKLDIEGHEFSALEGAQQLLSDGLIDIIQFEFGENNISSRTFLLDFIKILNNYEFFRIAPGGIVPFHYRGGVSEIFATMNYLAVRKNFQDIR